MKTFLITFLIIVVSVISMNAQEFTTTALDDFGLYVYQDYQPLMPDLYQTGYDVPMPYMQQPLYTIELAQPPGYNTWGPYYVPPFDYGDYLYVPQYNYNRYLPQGRGYDYTPYLRRPMQRSASYYILLDILNSDK